MMKRLVVATLAVSGAITMHPETSPALKGLAQLQEAAKQDQAYECMIHEYTRRYNEVLRGYSRRRARLTAGIEEEAHREAMRWVRAVWKYADQQTVEHSLKSEQFQSFIAAFQANQRMQYPHLGVVH